MDPCAVPAAQAEQALAEEEAAKVPAGQLAHRPSVVYLPGAQLEQLLWADCGASEPAGQVEQELEAGLGAYVVGAQALHPVLPAKGAM